MGDSELVGNLPSLIAFDLDGTLIDSQRDLAQSANQLIVELGGETLTDCMQTYFRRMRSVAWLARGRRCS